MQTFPKLDTPTVLSSIFHPRQCSPTPLPKNASEVEITVAPDVRIGCRFYLHAPESPTILFFHGNGEIAADYDDIGPLYNHTGLNLLVTDYRGYGWSDGEPTVSLMLEDAEVLFNEGRKWLKEHNYNGPLFLMGRSLGSVPAIDLATRHEDEIKGLILESAIANTIPLAKSLDIAIDLSDFSEDDGFRNIEKIKTVTKPTFIFHGARDALIAADEAENLQSHSGARTKSFLVIPGAEHNTMILTGGKLYFLTIKEFIDKLTGVANWRKRRKTTNTYTEDQS